jgi:hypothetical protein
MTIMIGGEEVTVPAMVWARLEEVWAHIESLSGLGAAANAGNGADGGPTPLQVAELRQKQSDLVIRIFSIALSKTNPQMTYEVMRDTLYNDEVSSLLDGVTELFEISGLTRGEPGPSGATAVEGSASTGTLTPSLPN